MRKTLAAVAMLFAFSALGGSISSIDQSTILMKSGEYFMTINGAGLGNQVLYTDTSSGATYRLDVNAADSTATSVSAWIPEAIVNDPGTYSVRVLGGTGDTAPVSFTVYKPGRPYLSLHLPEVLLALAKSRSGAYIKYDVTAIGGEGTPTVECDPVSGSLFPFGKSIVKCVAWDQSGKRVEGSIEVNVWDGVRPDLKLPQSFQLKAEDERGTRASFEVSASDDIDGEVGVKCSHDSGGFFPNGRTVINCEAVDSSLNPAYGAFEIFVEPKDPGRLQLSVPSEVVVTAENEYDAIVDYKVDAYGSADPDPVVVCMPESGVPFAIGETKVYCMAEDDFGARAEDGFLVVVKKPEGLRLSDVTTEALSPEGTTVGFDTDVEGWDDTLTCSHDSGSLFPIGKTEVTCAQGVHKGMFVVTVSDTIAPHVAAVRAKTAVGAAQDVAVSVEVDVTDAADAMPRCSIASLVNEQGGGFESRITGELEASVRNASAFRINVSCVDAAGNRATGSVSVRLATIGGERGRAN